jgi:hypothetical protein
MSGRGSAYLSETRELEKPRGWTFKSWSVEHITETMRFLNWKDFQQLATHCWWSSISLHHKSSRCRPQPSKKNITSILSPIVTLQRTYDFQHFTRHAQLFLLIIWWVANSGMTRWNFSKMNSFPKTLHTTNPKAGCNYMAKKVSPTEGLETSSHHTSAAK